MELHVNNRLWVISDTHFGHRNIVKFCQRPESHEVIMLSQWIDRVREDDEILHLGDVLLGKGGNAKRWAKVIGRLPGRKYMILGNHDKEKRSLYEDVCGFTILEPFIHRGPQFSVAFTHRPITDQFPVWAGERKAADATRTRLMQGNPLPLNARAGWAVNVHGHIHGNSLAEAAERHGEADAFPDRIYVNACVEMHDLAPVQLGNLLTMKP